MTFWIDLDRLFRQLREISSGLRQDKFSRGIKAAIEINGADERFKRVRQRRCSLASTTGFLAASHQKVTSQIERSGVHLQRFAGNEPGTQFCQLSFGFATKAVKEMFANHKLKDGVTEKFQPLIVKMIALR